MRRFAFALYCLALTALAILAAEFVLLPRLGGLPRDTLLMGFAATPDSVIDGQRINALGFTGDEIRDPPAANTMRVLVLGSSTMFNRHMAEHLQAAMQQKTQKKVELLNAGIRSHTTRADLYKLQLLARYHWDYVLFYDGINDLWANHVLPQDYREDYAHLDPWYHRNILLDHSLLARQLYTAFYWKLHALNRQWHEKLFVDYQFVFPKKPYMNAAAFASTRSFSANVEQIVRLSRTLGAKPVLITFASHLPAHYSRQAFLDKQLDYVNPDNYDVRDVFNWGPPDYVREGLMQQNVFLRDFAANEGVTLIDMDRQMSGRGEWFGDVCHFNDVGVSVFSQGVAEQWHAAFAGEL